MTISSNWWPKSLRSFGEANLLAGEMVTVAEISKPYACHSGLQLYTALVPTKKADELLSNSWSYDWPLETSGPHPLNTPAGKPWFRLGTRENPLEPLIVSWEKRG